MFLVQFQVDEDVNEDSETIENSLELIYSMLSTLSLLKKV